MPKSKTPKNKPEPVTPRQINILGHRFQSAIMTERYYIELYNEPFNIYNCLINIEDKAFIKMLFTKFKLNDSSFVFKKMYSENNNIKVVKENSFDFLIKIKEKMFLEREYQMLRIFYGANIKKTEIDTVLDIIEKCKKEKDDKGKFYMVVKGDDDFELKKFDVATTAKLNLKTNYNDDFQPTNKIISQFLQQDKKQGLVLLHGKYGTGKTSYIRHLINSVNKKIIFLPLELMENISSPTFLPFISRYQNSILVLEDCENLLKPREAANSSASGIVTLLNMSDGLLSDALTIKIICTFNADLKNIDKAILRKGRLIARYEFKELVKEKAQKLSNKLGFKTTITQAMTLADLYNQDQTDYQLHGDTNKIGFSKATDM